MEFDYFFFSISNFHKFAFFLMNKNTQLNALADKNVCYIHGKFWTTLKDRLLSALDPDALDVTLKASAYSLWVSLSHMLPKVQQRSFVSFKRQQGSTLNQTFKTIVFVSYSWLQSQLKQAGSVILVHDFVFFGTLPTRPFFSMPKTPKK